MGEPTILYEGLVRELSLGFVLGLGKGECKEVEGGNAFIGFG